MVAPAATVSPVRDGVIVNDVQSQLNRTRVREVARVGSLEALRRALLRARAEGCAVSVAGGRHAMGGQQFGADTLLLDMSPMRRVLDLDVERGHVTAEAGIQWPDLVRALLARQRSAARPWSIVQKQTGADRLSLGGALAANVHGRGLTLGPIVADVESFVLVGPDGVPRVCSRATNRGLFRLAIGGYGLFGVIASATLRLRRRAKLERRVALTDVERLPAAFERRIAQGFEYGDFQFLTDDASDRFLKTGILSCYRPVSDGTRVGAPAELSHDDWQRLAWLAHVDKRRAFDEYVRHYLTTDRQVYWSDLHQFSVYLDDYHAALDATAGTTPKGTEMIAELYVPRPSLPAFMDEAARALRAERADVVYGTVRLIERDDETLLAWARDRWACVVFNLHTEHTPSGVARSAAAFQALIDLAAALGGTYYLTYHRWARPDQVERCHPRLREFLALKLAHDPELRFQSDWYRHHHALVATP
jgi:FAD/FMN-containing dehydrogenase